MWAIKPTKEQQDEVRNWFDQFYEYPKTGGQNFYWHYPGYASDSYCKSYLMEGYTKVPFELFKEISSVKIGDKLTCTNLEAQFKLDLQSFTKASGLELGKQYTVKSVSVYMGEAVGVTLVESKNDYTLPLAVFKTRRIVGYKCPTDLYGGSVPKGTVFTTCTNKDYYMPWAGSDCLVPKEIAETWEPAFKKITTKLKLGNPQRDFTVAGDICIRDGAGVSRYFASADIDTLISTFDVKEFRGFSVTPNSIHIGCVDGVDLTLEDLKLLKTTYEGQK